MFRKITALAAALATTATLAVAAGPANAIYRDYETYDEPPVTERTVNSDDTSPSGVKDENGKYYCWSKNDDGTWTGAKHGDTKTVGVYEGRRNVTFRCNDGTWEEVVTYTSQSDDWSYDPSSATNYYEPAP